MEKKRMKRSKGGNDEDGMWDCSVCTYKNSAEAFKCAMCDVRKGTSTRKPKPNPQQLVAQQVAQQQQQQLAAVSAATHSTKRHHSVTSTKRTNASTSNASDSTAGETDTSMDSTDAMSHRNSCSLTPPISSAPRGNAHPSHPLSTSTPSAAAPSATNHFNKNKISVKKKIPKSHAASSLSKSSHSGVSTSSSTSTEASATLSAATCMSLEVTVGDVTVVITDYKPKRLKEDGSESQTVGVVKQESANVSVVNTDDISSNHPITAQDPESPPPHNTSNNVSLSSLGSSDSEATTPGSKGSD